MNIGRGPDTDLGPLTLGSVKGVVRNPFLLRGGLHVYCTRKTFVG